MQSIQLDKLPDFAQRELLDFYHFLLQKYLQRPLNKHKYLHKLSDGFFQTVQLFSGVGIHYFQHG